MLSSVEHGWQGDWLNVLEIAHDNDIPFVYGVEAYWVLDNSKKGLQKKSSDLEIT